MADPTNSKYFRSQILAAMNDAEVMIPGTNHPQRVHQTRSRKLTLRDLDRIPNFKMDKD